MRCSVLLLASTIATALFAEASGDWELVVRPPQPTDGVTLYWVGLRNSSVAERAVCALGVTYLYDRRGGDTVGVPAENYPGTRSAHPCEATEAHLVLPGETYFVRVAVPHLKDAATPRVRFEISAEEACVAAVGCSDRPFIALQQR